jgi:hypothetical protein
VEREIRSKADRTRTLHPLSAAGIPSNQRSRKGKE